MAGRSRGGKVVLFLDTDGRGRAARAVFEATAGRIGLAWSAVAARPPEITPAKPDAAMLKALRLRSVADLGPEPQPVTDAGLAAVESIVSFDEAVVRPVLERAFPDQASRVEFWAVGTGAETVAAIEREVSGLVARLLGGRTGNDIPEIPAETPAAPTPKKAVTVRVGRETKGRKGKGVTTVSDLPLDTTALAELATRLKGLCGSGGTAKEGRIEIQGDHRERLSAELERLGYRVKCVGG
jgi:predicted translation initiation factor SUI1